jgi:hypothetical protein
LGYGVAWNGSRWVAVGYGNRNILTSVDGLSWTPANNGFISGGGPGQGNGVAWNGLRWVAVGQGDEPILTSTDGLSWTGATGGFPASGSAFGVASNRVLPYEADMLKTKVANLQVGEWLISPTGSIGTDLVAQQVGIDGPTGPSYSLLRPTYKAGFKLDSEVFDTIVSPTGTTPSSIGSWRVVSATEIKLTFNRSYNSPTNPPIITGVAYLRTNGHLDPIYNTFSLATGLITTTFPNTKLMFDYTTPEWTFSLNIDSGTFVGSTSVDNDDFLLYFSVMN